MLTVLLEFWLSRRTSGRMDFRNLSENEAGKEMKCQVGDWIRFYQNGRLVIGVVEYITKGRLLGSVNDEELCTTSGTVNADQVLEKRSQK